MSKKSLAIIGSGISGLSAAVFLSNKYNVHLFEKNDVLGGHTRTKFIQDKIYDHNIDTGFIVFNEKNYPDFTNFLNFLKVKTSNSNMSFSFSCKLSNIEYGGSNIRSLFAQPKNLFSINFLLLLKDIFIFYNLCKKIKKINNFYDLTIEEFLNLKKYNNRIRDLHIYPMISSIWSSNKRQVKNFPLILFLNFFRNHGLFNFENRPQWKFIKEGSKSYIEAILQKNLFKYDINFKIKKVIRKNNIVNIINHKNILRSFDLVVFATHADQALKLLEAPTKNELKILSEFKYTKNTAYLHSDLNFMPKHKAAWSSWNFLQNLKDEKVFSLTYWMNNLQNLKGQKNYFLSVNPSYQPNAVYDEVMYEHPIFNLNTIEAQKKIKTIQGLNNTYYCGSYCGYGFHEDGIQSSAYVSNLLGISLPWTRNKNFYNRLNY